MVLDRGQQHPSCQPEFDIAVVKVVGPMGVEYLQEGKLGSDWKIILGGFLTGDSTRAGRGLHPGLSKKALRRGPAGEYFLESWGQGKHFHWTGVRQPNGTLPWGHDGKEPKLDITIMDHSGDIASVKIHWGYDVNGENAIQIDYLDFANLEGRWQAVNILCSGQLVSEGEWTTWW